MQKAPTPAQPPRATAHSTSGGGVSAANAARRQPQVRRRTTPAPAHNCSLDHQSLFLPFFPIAFFLLNRYLTISKFCAILVCGDHMMNSQMKIRHVVSTNIIASRSSLTGLPHRQKSLRLFPFTLEPLPLSDVYLLEVYPSPPPLKKCPYCATINADEWGCLKCGIVFKEWEDTTKRSPVHTFRRKTVSNEVRWRGWSIMSVLLSGGLIAFLVVDSLISPGELVSTLRATPSHAVPQAEKSPTILEKKYPRSEIKYAIPQTVATISYNVISPRFTENHRTTGIPGYSPQPVTTPIYPAHGWSSRLMLYNSSGDVRFLPPCHSR